MSTTAATPKIFRVTVEVSSVEEGAAFYAKLLGIPGKRHPGARHYFDCGGAKALGALAPFQVHGQPAGEVIQRPWGEKSFYVTDPWGNELCFVEEGTLYT
jgi:catechol 2,3-dioxygenase-like lactoylglutathione lyase family enzyme